MKRALPIIAGLAVLAIPGVAYAHSFTHTPTCGGLAWAARDYQTSPNTIVVTIDGQVVHSATFDTNDIGSRTWTQTVAHSWRIVVDAPGTSFDRNVTGTQAACQPTTTTSTTSTTSSTSTTTPEATTTIPPTTTSGVVTTVSTPSTTTDTSSPSSTTPPVPPSSDTPVTTPVSAEPLDRLPSTGVSVPWWWGAVLIVAGLGLSVVARRRPT